MILSDLSSIFGKVKRKSSEKVVLIMLFSITKSLSLRLIIEPSVIIILFFSNPKACRMICVKETFSQTYFKHQDV